MRQLVIETDDGTRGHAFPIRRAQTTLGRRPHNDIVIEDRMVSGQHAVLTLSGHDLVVEDMNSTKSSRWADIQRLITFVLDYQGRLRGIFRYEFDLDGSIINGLEELDVFRRFCLFFLIVLVPCLGKASKG